MEKNSQNKTGKIGLVTAVAVVIANMVGTGVFTSLGFQVLGIESGFTLLALWVVGGIAALSGALTYGEIGSALPRSGGEFHYLSRIYHPAVGFTSGWVSATVGFAAPVALAAMALGKYFTGVFYEPGGAGAEDPIIPRIIALSVVVMVSLVHMQNLKTGGQFQNVFTGLKLFLILILIFSGIILAAPQSIGFMPDENTMKGIFSQPFAISLVYVMYAYSGWNASSYIAGEVKDPRKNLPRSLLIGTSVVMVLYVLINFVFLYTTPIEAMKGKLEVGLIASESIFGVSGGKIMGMLISLSLISSISSMVWAGPRVTQVIGEDIPFFRKLSKTNPSGIPVTAIVIQLLIAVVLVMTSTFDVVINYTIFTLILSSLVTVVGVFVLRYRFPNAKPAYRTWGYPVTPLIFIGISIWMLIFLAMNKPWEAAGGIVTILVGLGIWALTRSKEDAQTDSLDNEFEQN